MECYTDMWGLRTFIVMLCAVVALNAPAQQLRFFEFGFRTPLPDSVNVIAAATKQELVDKALAQLALPEGERNLFLNGEIQYGRETNNPIYSWHFVTDAWDLVELAVEVCDGRPDDVENDKQYWIETVGHFCPWSSFVKREVFPLDVDDPSPAPFRVYPNPTTNVLTVDAAEPSIELTVVNVLGKVVVRGASGEKSIDLSSFPSGHYYIVIRHSAGNAVYKIAKR